MQRIGIATFFDDNFGTCLQAYALQQTIKKLGYEPEIIRYYRGERNVQTESRWKKLFRYSPKTVYKYVTQRGVIERKRAAFQRFRSQDMLLSTDAYYRDSHLDALKDKYDAYVCGSDMIWSEDFQEDWAFLYLSFADKSKSVAYAPSFGRNHLSDDNIKRCKPYIEGIGFLSCREQAGVKLIKRHFNLDATHVIDPTLLLTSEDWNKAIGKSQRLVEKNTTLPIVFWARRMDGKRYSSK